MRIGQHLAWFAGVAALAAVIVVSIGSPSASAQSQSESVRRPHHHHPKLIACEKQADAQKLHFKARRAFVRTCAGGKG